MTNKTTNRRSRAARLLAGAIVGSVLSVGAAASSADAWGGNDPVPVAGEVQVHVSAPKFGEIMRFSSGIRW